MGQGKENVSPYLCMIISPSPIAYGILRSSRLRRGRALVFSLFWIKIFSYLEGSLSGRRKQLWGSHPLPCPFRREPGCYVHLEKPYVYNKHYSECAAETYLSGGNPGNNVP